MRKSHRDLLIWWYSQSPAFPAPCSSYSVVQPKMVAWIIFYELAVSKLRICNAVCHWPLDMTPQNDFNHRLEKIVNPQITGAHFRKQ